MSIPTCFLSLPARRLDFRSSLSGGTASGRARSAPLLSMEVVCYIPFLIIGGHDASGRGRSRRSTRMEKLERTFYDRETLRVAKELLGKYLIHRSDGVERIGRIVEVEAYLGPHDLAAHSARGLTERTKIMFGPPGHAYVYLIYGIHCCMNVVTEREGQAAAVLLRALEPVKNIEDRTQGPGLLCRAMQIDRRLNGQDLQSDRLYIAAEPEDKPPVIVKRPRIGVDYAGHWARRLLRFYIRGNPFVSKP